MSAPLTPASPQPWRWCTGGCWAGRVAATWRRRRRDLVAVRGWLSHHLAMSRESSGLPAGHETSGPVASSGSAAQGLVTPHLDADIQAANRCLDSAGSRSTREDLRALAKTWGIPQKESGRKRTVPQLKDSLRAAVNKAVQARSAIAGPSAAAPFQPATGISGAPACDPQNPAKRTRQRDRLKVLWKAPQRVQMPALSGQRFKESRSTGGVTSSRTNSRRGCYFP